MRAAWEQWEVRKAEVVGRVAVGEVGTVDGWGGRQVVMVSNAEGGA